jgi:hypothetical protein
MGASPDRNECVFAGFDDDIGAGFLAILQSKNDPVTVLRSASGQRFGMASLESV